MILRSSSLLSKNECKLVFQPYTRDQLRAIMADMFTTQIDRLGLRTQAYYKLLDPKAIMLAAGKIDKISGDIRVCFEILRSAIQAKLDEIKALPVK